MTMLARDPETLRLHALHKGKRVRVSDGIADPFEADALAVIQGTQYRLVIIECADGVGDVAIHHVAIIPRKP